MSTALIPEVRIDGEELRVHFDRFDIEAYKLFLKVKTLPEFNLVFHDDTETYTISSPARFAHLLGVQHHRAEQERLPLPEWMYDDQAAITMMALDAKRFACWIDCALGKTYIESEFARQAIHLTGGRALIFTFNEVVSQWIEMIGDMYHGELEVYRIKSRAEMREWCKQPGTGLAITNYEKLNPDEQGQVVNELRYLTCVVADEGGRLAQSAGKQKWALIKSTKGIPYKMTATATPAPNDYIEFASQASFLERMRDEGEVIWTFFQKDNRTQKWTVKRHAREAFFDWMSTWSIYMRDPRQFGWRKTLKEVPKPLVMRHEIEVTQDQVAEYQNLHKYKGGQRALLETSGAGIVSRSKMSQLAKGFIYLKGKKVKRIPSNKPGFVADLVAKEVADGLQVLVWTGFDEESVILAEEFTKRGVSFEVLTGKTKDDKRLEILDAFRHGTVRVLCSLAQMVGFGQNFKHCGSMVFSHWSDSYTSFYQATRRAYGMLGGRYEGQLRVHLPIITLLEGDMLDNLETKKEKNEAAIVEMEKAFIRARRRLEL